MAAKQKIMIVDDDSNIAELISLYLTKECFDTRIVGDGEAALRSFDSFAPNLILLDLMLPGMAATRSVGKSASAPTSPSSCFPPRARFSTRSWDWSWVRTII